MFSTRVSLFVLLLLAVQAASAISLADYEQQIQAQFGQDKHLKPRRHPYGFWDSPLSPEWVSQKNTFEDVFVDSVDGSIYWSERRPTEGGKNILRKASIWNDPVFDGPWDARTIAHEYGGGHAIAHNGTVYFSNIPDNRVYQILPGGTPRPVTPARPEWRYADFTVHPVYPRFLIAIREDHSHTLGDCIVNAPVIIDTETGVVRVAGMKPVPPQPGCGPRYKAFFDSPRFSPDGRYLSIRTWNHPYMSWESSEIWTCEIQPRYDSSGDITLETMGLCVGLGDEEDIALGEPNWVNADSFIFTNNVNGFINPWIYDAPTGKARAILTSAVNEDFGEATWRFSMSHLAVLDEDRIFVTSFRDGRSRLYVIKLSDGTIQPVLTGGPFAYVSYVRRVADGFFALLGSTNTTSLDLWTVRLQPRCPGDNHAEPQFEPSVIRVGDSSSVDVPIEYISLPTTYTLAHRITGELIHAIYWPPTNPQYIGGLPGELPPVVVNVHGGPTHMTHQGFNWETQMFTSRGFGWLSVNYGGSMTYGVDYRKRLLGRWGIVDVEDTIEAVKQLGELGLLDASRAVIRGVGSGGFTTFAALTTASDFFVAGTAISGVSDLRTLQANLHKFESHYLLKYVGGTPETDPELWWERSPLSKAANIRSPLLILHGAEDTVVPVHQALAMLEAVKKHGRRTELHVFEGEGHSSWRQAMTIRKALEKEIDWYKDVLRGD